MSSGYINLKNKFDRFIVMISTDDLFFKSRGTLDKEKDTAGLILTKLSGFEYLFDFLFKS
jgi:hypothetical protein